MIINNVHGQELSFIKMPCLPKLSIGKHNLDKNHKFFVDIEKVFLKFIWRQKTQKSQVDIEKGKKNQRTNTI